jgi:DNA-binding MarR family transcriptional regulator
MRAQTNKRRRAPRRGVSTKDFDAEGIQRALLAALEYIYRSTPHLTLPQFLVALEVMIAERDGNPHTLVSLVKKLDMPFSTASRVVWSLTDEGGDVGVVKYIPHPTDRRKKLLAVNSKVFDRAVPKAMTRALVDYYGDSINKLKRAAN